MSQNKSKNKNKDDFKTVLTDGKTGFDSEVPPIQEYTATKACPTKKRKN